FNTITRSWSGVFIGVAGCVEVVVVDTGLVVDVVAAGFFAVVAGEPALLVSTRWSRNTPTITASPISSAPFKAAEPAPRATSPPPPDGRLMSAFCPVVGPSALTFYQGRRADLRSDRVEPARVACGDGEP